jgi:ferredoxin
MLAWLRAFLSPKPPSRHACCRSARAQPERPAGNPDRLIVRAVIDDGCTICGGCEVTCPEVFSVTDDGVVLVATAAEHFVSKRAEIEEAAEGCPMQVLTVHYGDGSVFGP